MNTSANFESFRLQALIEGFDEALEREWPPLTLLDMHTHPFAAKAVVTRGEMWLTVGDLTRWGLRTPAASPLRQLRHEGKTPVIDVGTLQRIRAGDIAVHEYAIHAPGQVLADGPEAELLIRGLRAIRVDIATDQPQLTPYRLE